MNLILIPLLLQVGIMPAPAPSALLVWHEDKRIPEKAADWETNLRATEF